MKLATSAMVSASGMRKSPAKEPGMILQLGHHPPYSINNANTKAPLNSRTIDVDATHHGGILEYNTHNLFG